jgi:copper chaperone CopZ
VRSALLAVKGVERARVMLEEGEAIVTYDPSQATIDDLITAVNQAQGPVPYTAKLKDLPR